MKLKNILLPFKWILFLSLIIVIGIFIYFLSIAPLLRWSDRVDRTIQFLLYETDHQAFLDACREVLTMPSDELKLFPENDHLPGILQEWLRKQDELNLLQLRYSYMPERTELWLYFGGGHFQCGLLAVADRVEQQAAAQYNYKIQLLDGLFYFADEMNASTVRKLKPDHLPEPTWWSQL